MVGVGKFVEKGEDVGYGGCVRGGGGKRVTQMGR